MNSPAPVNILLVDDQPSKLLTYEVILHDLGETLLKASSAKAALEQLLKQDIAVVLIDVVMPDLDGFELAQMIREHPRFQRTAIIFVSAIAMTDLDRLRGYELGAVDYVQVPVEPQLLRARVRVFADLYRKTRQLEALNEELEERVRERTAELAAANADLEQRVEQRTREREMALARVHEMQKLESLGQLTGGVAHDFNNLLTIIMSSLEILRKRVGSAPQLLTLIDGAMQGAERGVSLTRRMLAFARRQELRPQSVDIGALVRGMEEMLRRTLGPHIEIATDLCTNLPGASVDPSQLEMALLNLAVNARDAMCNGGRLTIATRRGLPGETMSLSLTARDYVCVSVADTRTGMDAATLRRAREPFYTTKDIGKGTGLGLSMVDGLAAQSGGLMRIESALGVGTTVELWLPASDGAMQDPTGKVEGTASSDGRRFRVLLVDDDHLVRTSTASMLEDLGHSVIESSSAAGAISALSNGTKVEVVLTDEGMPDMTGSDLARHIRRVWPSLPVVLITGFIERAREAEPSVPVLRKPFRQEELAAMLEKVVLTDLAANVIMLGGTQA